MYNQYGGYPPPDWFYWQMMANQQHRPTGRSRRGHRDTDPIRIMRSWDAYQEAKDKKKKDADKDKKKPPSGAESLMSFAQWWAVMTVFGLPIGLITLKVLNMMVQTVPVIITNAVK